MKKSEIIKEQLATEENDLKALGIERQLIREKRSERFEDMWLPKMKEKLNVKHDAQMGRYTFEFGGYGVIDFYPRANKLLFRVLNKWKKPALRWLIAELKLEDE